MKGILLAGGSGTRLFPITQVTSKQLLPVYDKPMIYYPLSSLMLSGVRDILIISTERDVPQIANLLGDGRKLGLNLSYAIQEAPRGLPEAFLIGEDFIKSQDVILALGDNIFYGYFDFLREAVASQLKKAGGFRARIFGYYVDDPRRYGVAEIDRKTNKVVSLEEKPDVPKSNYAIPGLYLFDETVASRVRNLQPSARGELEITDLIKTYLAEGSLSAEIIGRGIAWLDAGTPESMLEASHFIAVVERRQGLKVACLEEIALRQGFLERQDLIALTNAMPKGSYRAYLNRVLSETE